MIIRSLTVLVFAIATVNATDVAAEITIDRYTVGSTIAQIGQGTSLQTTNSGDILGGSRDSVLTVPDLGGSELFGVMGFAGNLQLAQGNSDRIQGSLTYDDFTAIDLTEAGANTNFAIRVSATDSNVPLANVFSLTVTSGLNSDTVGFSLPANTNLPAYSIVNFSDFAGVDMTSVDSIVLDFDFALSPGENVLIDRLFAANGIPEPVSAMLLVPLAIFAATGRRRQFRK